MPAPTDTTEGATTSSDAPPPSRRARRIAVGALVVLTTLGVLTSTIATWTHRVVFNTDAWVSTVGPLAEDPAVTNALATYLTDELFAMTNAQQLAENALPQQASFLAAPLTDAVHGFLRDKTGEFLASDTFQDLWVRINRATHQAAVQLLRGETVAGVSIDNGTVSLNLMPLLVRIISFVQDKAPGLFGDRGPVPQITQDTPPDQARAELSTWLGRTLKPTFGVVTLFKSDDLAAAQQAVKLFDTLVWVLIGVTIALGAATIVLSLNRRRTLIQLGLGIALAIALAAAVVSAVKAQLLELIADPANRAAAEAALRELVATLRLTERVLLVGGLTVAVVAFLAGDHRWAVAFRAAIGRATGSAQDTISKHRPTETPSFPWLTEHRAGLQVAGVVAAVGLLLVTDPDWGSLLLAGLALALYEVLLVLLSGPPSPVPEPR